MNNKPVAWMYRVNNSFNTFSTIEPPDDAYDEGTLTPLYTHPVKELNDAGEPVKNATYWKRQYNLMASQNDNLKSGLYHVNEQIKYLEAHPVKELTDGEIQEISHQYHYTYNPDYVGFARAILRKAQNERK